MTERATTTRAVVLRHHLSGLPRPEDFELTEAPLAAPGPGEVVVEVADLSLDPYLRTALAGGHMDDDLVPLGGVVPGRSIATVIESAEESAPVGSLVLAQTGWQERAVVAAKSLVPVSLPDGIPASAALGAFGMPGLTAYAALERHLLPRAGETVVVSSATGGVGSVAGQLLRAAGVRPVAIVGSAAKAEDAARLGYEASVLRTDPDWLDALSAACPDGIDGYLHMGDMPTLNGVMGKLSVGARVSLCGLMDQYNDGPRTMLSAGAIMTARAIVHGMVVYDHMDLTAAHVARVGELFAAGELILHEDRHLGLASAPKAFAQMMAGANQGKVVVEVSQRG